MARDPEEERPHTEDDEGGGPVKSFLEHLEDFRWTLIKSSAAVFVCVLICMLAGNHVVAILVRPLQKAQFPYPKQNQVVTVNFLTNRLGVFQLGPDERKHFDFGTNHFVSLDMVPTDVTIGTNQIKILAVQVNTNTAGQSDRMNMNLIVLGPAHAFLVGFRVALYAGIAMASPFIFFFVGQFVLPALRITEKKYLYRGLLFAVPLFVSGVLFCYFILMPAALAASQMYSNWFGFQSTMWEAGEYIEFVSKFMLGMGLGFELPVVVLILVKIGLIDYRTLVKARPYMIVINLILGAVLTTPEVFTQVLMAIPLQVLFEISVFIAWYWHRQDKKREAAAEAAERAGK